MILRARVYRTLLLTFALAVCCGTASAQNIPLAWQTHAEKTNYRETPRYRETVAYARRLAAASKFISYQEFGTSSANRPLPLLVADKQGFADAVAVKKSGRAVILIQGCIHAGESDGKDAGLALLRDIAITQTHLRLLDWATVLFIPIYNVDGHEDRFGPFNRFNQNGPAQMGWRATAINLNLNRDYMKADAPETRAWLKLWNKWQPDLFIDCHVTDGADYRYHVTYQYEQFENIAAPVRDWMRQKFEGIVVPAVEKVGHLLAPYLEFKDNRDFSRGVSAFISTPRFATGYAPLRNRPGLLIETHMLKDYRTRVRGTYDVLRCALEEVNRDSKSLLRAVREADAAVSGEGRTYDSSRRVPLAMELTTESTPFVLKGVDSRVEKSEVSGAARVIFGAKPVDITVPRFQTARPARVVAPPLYYIVPPQWREVIAVLEAHGIELRRTTSDVTLEVETYRFRNVQWPNAPFEGRFGPRFETEPVRLRRRFAAGSVLVAMAQPAARVALHLLEPQAPDSFVAWGFFNAIFERKEFGEPYLVEKLAREMLAKDENLKKEFERRLQSDREFAASPTARLNFFYERSPYMDQEFNLYRVGRIVDERETKALK